ncbi:hypothetical protein ACMAZH_05815 [Arenicellales bacterium nBUS_45]
MSAGKDTYLLALGDKLYSVSKMEDQWMVYDMSAMRALVGNAGSQHTQALIGADAQERDLKNTGRTEVISGIQGTVYNYYEPLTQREVEIVLTDDPILTDVTEKWVHFTSLLSGVQSEDSAKRFAGKGILRSNDFRVIRLSKGPANNDRFELPATPASFGVDLPKTLDMATLSDNTLPAQSSSDEATGLTIETEVVNEASRIARRTGRVCLKGLELAVQHELTPDANTALKPRSRVRTQEKAPGHFARGLRLICAPGLVECFTDQSTE